MWKTLALAVAALTVAAAPQLLPGSADAPKPLLLPEASLLPAKETFAPVCRDDEVLRRPADPAWVGQSFLGDNCQAPSRPPVINGHKASREQIMAGMAAVKTYAAAADAFQKCVSDFVAARKVQGGQSLTPSQLIIQNHRILASQRSEETVASQMHMSIMAFNSYGSDCPM